MARGLGLMLTVSAGGEVKVTVTLAVLSCPAESVTAAWKDSWRFSDQPRVALKVAVALVASVTVMRLPESRVQL